MQIDILQTKNAEMPLVKKKKTLTLKQDKQSIIFLTWRLTMLKRFNKPILFTLILVVSSSFCNISYGMSTLGSIKFNPTKTKDAIFSFLQNESVKPILIYSAIFIAAPAIATMAIIKFCLKDASPETKKTIIALGKRLGVKNPEKIKVKVLPTFLFGTGKPFGPNAMALLNGDMAISKNFDDDHLSDVSKFIFGHELTHIKNKHIIKQLLGLILTSLSVIYLSYKYNFFKKINEYTKKSTFLNIVTKYLAGNLIFKTLPNIIPIIFKYETQADLGAASLGKDVAEGGILLFTYLNNQLTPEQRGTLKIKHKLFLDAHPDYKTRIKDIQEYTAKNYTN